MNVMEQEFKLRKDGYGVIAAVSVETDPAIDPLSLNGRPLRPIPVDHSCAADIDPATPQAEDTWRPPYWSAENRARCYLPDRQTFN